jgi:hypothetical protein
MAQSSRARAARVSEEQAALVELTTEEIAQRAYTLYIARGAADGHDVEDWLEAERLLSEDINRSAARST